MSPKSRRLIHWLFVIAFLLAAPAIILSTAGYRYNFARHRFERTGVLVIDTVPAGAKIYVNDKLRQAKTPARVTRLSPGRYRVRLEKDGFRPWQKSVEIESSQTTFLNGVALFSLRLPELKTELPASASSFSPDGRYAAIVSGPPSLAELRIFDLKTGESFLPYRSPVSETAPFSFSWTGDSKRLLMTRPGKPGPAFLIWEASWPQTLTDAGDLSGIDADQAFWSEDGRSLYVAAQGLLSVIDPASGAAVQLGPAASDMTVVGGFVYGVSYDKDETRLTRRPLKDGTFESLALLSGDSYQPLPETGRSPVFVSAPAGRLIVIKPADGGLAPDVYEVRGNAARWSPDKRKLLYWNDFELRVYDLEAGSDELVTRVSTPIIAAAWYPAGNAIVYADQKNVSAVEARNGGERTVTPVAELSELSDFALNRTGDAAYFVGAIGQKSGIWEMKLR